MVARDGGRNEDGAYDPADFNDRLLLGLKGRSARRSSTCCGRACAAASSTRRAGASCAVGWPNRLVASSLEADWNAKLRALDEAQHAYERQRANDRLVVDQHERQRIVEPRHRLPRRVARPRHAGAGAQAHARARHRGVTVLKQRQITAAVRFRGGATTTVTRPRPVTAQQMRASHADVRQQIDALLDEYTDAQVAHRLNERGLRTGAGEAFDSASVQWVRFSAKLKSLKERLLDAGMLTRRQICATLGISRTELGRWRQQGRVTARICNDLGEWLYWLPKQIPPPATRSPDETVTSTAGGAV